LAFSTSRNPAIRGSVLHFLVNLRNLHALWLQEREDRQPIADKRIQRGQDGLCATSHGPDILRYRMLTCRRVGEIRFCDFPVPICAIFSQHFLPLFARATVAAFLGGRRILVFFIGGNSVADRIFRLPRPILIYVFGHELDPRRSDDSVSHFRP